jgi:hypothetical protein
VLSGQPELEDKLKLPQLRQLKQRITLRCKTAPLTKEQTHAYITERLRIAGSAEQIFSPESMDAVHLYSMGIPRIVNLLCEHSLINTYVEQERVVTPKVVEDIAREFQLDEIDPIPPPNSVSPIDNDVYSSETFVQNLGEALSRFRISSPTVSSSRDKK